MKLKETRLVLKEVFLIMVIPEPSTTIQIYNQKQWLTGD